MEYTDNGLIAHYLKRDLTSEEQDYLSVFIPAVRKWIDNKTSSHFLKVEESSRTFDGAGGRSLDITPCTEISAFEKLNEDGSVAYEYTTDQYVPYPQNETVKNEIVLRASSFKLGVANYRVTAKFSEFEDRVPEDIQAIATRIAGDMIREAQILSTGNVQSESLEGHSIAYRNPNEIIDKIAMNDPVVNSLLEMRKNILVG